MHGFLEHTELEHQLTSPRASRTSRRAMKLQVRRQFDGFIPRNGRIDGYNQGSL